MMLKSNAVQQFWTKKEHMCIHSSELDFIHLLWYIHNTYILINHQVQGYLNNPG